MRRNLHAAHLNKARSVTPHFAIISEPFPDILENLRCSPIARLNDSIVHPLALSTRSNDSRTSEVCQMPRDLGLMCLEDFDEITYAHLILTHQVEKAQASAVRERAKQQFHVKASFGLCHKAGF